MTNPATYPGPPIDLPLRLDADPRPAPMCGVCGALARQRAEAREQGDMSMVTDINIELRAHSHKERY